MQNRSTPNHDNFRSREHPVENDDCCSVCCCCCCSIWLYLFCCRSMKRTLRVKLLWGYMMILGLTAGVVTGLVIFGSVDTEMAISDMRVIDQKLSHIFCDSVDIESDDFESLFDAYFMQDTPKIDPDKREIYNETYSQFVEQNSNVYKQFYLLAGSTVKLTGEVDSFIDLNLISGQDNFNKYIDNGMDCVECVLDDSGLFDRGQNHIKFDIQETGLYFFVFVSRLADTWMELRFSLRRTVYDTSESLVHCDYSTSCVFDYDMTQTGTPVVIIHAKNSDKEHYDERTFTITTSCVARSWLYVLIFLGIPSLLSIVISVIIIRRCSDPQPEVTYVRQRPHERTPLLWDTVRAPAVVVLPPKYEDIVRTDNDLPSYEEATASMSSVVIQSSNQTNTS
ncbi:uncharacterized protein LOC110463648 [Mizuhopecten yessoensis]|uniref:Uncharacterized protein n=1 Tax=Mizuhopecten yessoensis TaxID=6573 RepID=A0A210PVR1_MIZYE|nr:uncharacterized protein LOC110463648 [Mizuhopecten yessoensis]XP_021374115.1 uncharacterized protein LOC110463648 [Mizuhopecten yessoensis]XP_021374116.1 uncharacterized protein LOC110463648 [Mizuhopecten yessoensis]XP_021374117.1 uncharacterized protein LOC110463648 [Mizuhopecten yessoensis]XP_021374118.1 uncharacterized protein LOC110463648 [Mizuhopecten yessoensis]XP_021374119.1 uncharacterized protein LOC110463648 [Mizuhopecten yessoensis]OWF40556.1 hypothetical protein KP79_PYT19990 [